MPLHKTDSGRRTLGKGTARYRIGITITVVVSAIMAVWVTLASSGVLDPALRQKNKSGHSISVASMNANVPSKEYIYAGSRLIATEEGTQAGGGGQGRAVFNFDLDGKSEIGFYRSTDGTWGLLKSSQNYSFNNAQFFGWGGAGLPPIYGDFDGDGKADIGYVAAPSGGQPAEFYILLSTRNYSFALGQPLFVPAGWPGPPLGDTPVVGDFDGDGKADPSTWRSSTGVWTIPTSSSNYSSYFFTQWGQAGDIPIVADFDGDGKSDVGFYRNGLWGVLQSQSSAGLFVFWGGAGLQPVVGDFDGDGRADIGYMVPPSGGQSATYAILLSSQSYSSAQPLFVPAGYPSLGDTPVVGDWDGDGMSDPGIWRASQGIWIIPLSRTNYTSYLFTQWGQSGDTPLPGKVTEYLRPRQ